MPREIDVLIERHGYQVIEVSETDHSGFVLLTWIELVRPSGQHLPCVSVEAAEEFIDFERQPPPAHALDTE
ncbi:MAG: hypothetical protein ACYC9P_03025 [Rudaea sp.]